jgi:HEAT repeat protein
VVLVAALGVIAWQTSAPAESPLAGAPAAKELSPVHPVTKQPVLLETDGENEPKAQRGDQPATPVDDAESDVERRLFDALGVRVKQANASKLSNHFRGGLEIIEVENRARAGELGLRAGDVLVGIHVWEVTSLDDARFIFGRPEIASGDRIKLFIQRGGKTMFLTAALAAQGSADERQESDKPRLRSSVAAPVTPKELLRYDGKTFAQWREEWRTELKPERREEAIAAFRVFAANGFGPEAAQVIIEVMRSYDIGVSDKHDRAENNLKSTAIHAFNRIDSEDALPALIAELRDGNRNGRLFSLSVIGNLGHRADGALPAVLSAAKSDDAAIRVAALETAAELARFTGAKGEAYLPTVVAAFDDDSPAVRAAALKIAVDRAPDTKELLPAVRKALTDSDPGLVVAAIDVLLPLRRGLGVGTARAIPSESFGVDEGGFGDFALDEGVGVREPGVYVPELLDALKHSQDRVWRSAAQAIELLRGSAKDAIPRLLDMSITGPQYEQERAAYVLHKLTSLPRGQELELIHAALLDDLMRRLKDENRQQRVTGLQLLNRYSSRLGSVVVDVIPLLRPFLTDEDEQVREQAQRLLDAFEVYKSRPFRGSSFDRP